MPKKKPAKKRPGTGVRFEIRLRPAEKVAVEQAAARSVGPDGRSLTVSAWARSVLLAAAGEGKR